MVDPCRSMHEYVKYHVVRTENVTIDVHA
jgi:hypothetical protein